MGEEEKERIKEIVKATDIQVILILQDLVPILITNQDIVEEVEGIEDYVKGDLHPAINIRNINKGILEINLPPNAIALPTLGRKEKIDFQLVLLPLLLTLPMSARL